MEQCRLPQRLLPLSRIMARVLRHSGPGSGLTIDSNGWCQLEALLRLDEMANWRHEDVVAVVQDSYSNNRPRFELSESPSTPGTSIRATTKHSCIQMGQPQRQQQSHLHQRQQQWPRQAPSPSGTSSVLRGPPRGQKKSPEVPQSKPPLPKLSPASEASVTPRPPGLPAASTTPMVSHLGNRGAKPPPPELPQSVEAAATTATSKPKPPAPTPPTKLDAISKPLLQATRAALATKNEDCGNHVRSTMTAQQHQQQQQLSGNRNWRDTCLFATISECAFPAGAACAIYSAVGGGHGADYPSNLCC